MERTDFYKAIRIEYDKVTTINTVTTENNIVESVIIGGLITCLTEGQSLIAELSIDAIGSLVTGYGQKTPGEYKVDCIIAYSPVGYRNIYDSILTQEIYYKSNYYDNYTKTPISNRTFYNGVVFRKKDNSDN